MGQLGCSTVSLQYSTKQQTLNCKSSDPNPQVEAKAKGAQQNPLNYAASSLGSAQDCRKHANCCGDHAICEAAEPQEPTRLHGTILQ